MDLANFKNSSRQTGTVNLVYFLGNFRASNFLDEIGHLDGLDPFCCYTDWSVTASNRIRQVSLVFAKCVPLQHVEMSFRACLLLEANPKNV